MPGVTDPALHAKLRRFAFVPRYRPLTPAEIAAAREYRAQGLSWSQTAAVLRRNKTSVRAAVGAACAAP